jgi:hypothetical protein
MENLAVIYDFDQVISKLLAFIEGQLDGNIALLFPDATNECLSVSQLHEGSFEQASREINAHLTSGVKIIISIQEKIITMQNDPSNQAEVHRLDKLRKRILEKLSRLDILFLFVSLIQTPAN